MNVATAVPCDHLPCHIPSQSSSVPRRPRPIRQDGRAGRLADGTVHDDGFYRGVLLDCPPPMWPVKMQATPSWQQSPRFHHAWPRAQRKELHHGMVPKKPGGLYRMNTKPKPSFPELEILLGSPGADRLHRPTSRMPISHSSTTNAPQLIIVSPTSQPRPWTRAALLPWEAQRRKVPQVRLLSSPLAIERCAANGTETPRSCALTKYAGHRPLSYD